MSLRRAGALALSLVSTSCGSRTDVLFADGAYGRLDGGRDAHAPDGADGSSAIAPSGTCKWSLGPTTQLTQPPDDHQVTSAIHVEGGALVGTMSSDDPATDRSWVATPLRADGTLAGAPIAVFGGRPDGLSIGGLSLADGFGRRAAMAWDSRDLCRFAELDAGSSAPGPVTVVSKEYCSGLHATPRGYRWVEGDLSPGWTHVIATYEAGVRSVGAPVTPLADKAYWFAVVGAPDGATIAAWIAEGRTPAQIVGSGIGGRAIDGPTIEGKGRWIRLAPSDDGKAAHVVWVDGPSGASSASVRFATLDRTTASFDPAHLVSAQAFRDGGVGLGTANGDVLVAWMEGDATHAQRLYVQPLERDGTPRADRLLVSQFFAGSSPRLIATSNGAVVVYMAEPTAAPMQVYATALNCPP